MIWDVLILLWIDNTPKKIIEALIKNVNLKNKHELIKIDNSISGKRTFKKQLELEEHIEPKECTEAILSRMKDSSKVDRADEIEQENDPVQVGELDKSDVRVEPKETIHAFTPEPEESDKNR